MNFITIRIKEQIHLKLKYYMNVLIQNKKTYHKLYLLNYTFYQENLVLADKLAR